MAYAILGDSYIKRLDKFTRGRISYEYDCKFFGVSGMSTRNKFTEAYECMLSHRPRYVFVLLGGNNINYDCTPSEIVEDLKWLVNNLKSNGVERVFVSEIITKGKFPKWVGIDKETFDKIRKSINMKMRKFLGSDFVSLGNKILHPKHFDQDLVHPGVKQGGMIKLRCAVRSAFYKTLKEDK